MDKKIRALEKELRYTEKQEQRMAHQCSRETKSGIRNQLEEKVPKKVYLALNKAFCKAFFVVFAKGTQIIEKSYDKEGIEKEFQIREHAIFVRGERKDVKALPKARKSAAWKETIFTTVEGIGLGALGIGLPDIVLFVAMLLRGTYETALGYGFGYESRKEQYLILKMMEIPVLRGEEWQRGNKEIDDFLKNGIGQISEEELERQIERTSQAFAIDMLLLKFIQGIPIVGMAGGACNPIYYRKVMKYVQLKYKKRYLISLMNDPPGQ